MIENYEEINYHLKAPDSIVAIKIRMEEIELPQDLEQMVKSKIYQMPKWEPAQKDWRNVCFIIKAPFIGIQWNK